MAEQRSLLIAEHRPDRNFRTEPAGIRDAEISAGHADFRQHRPGDIQFLNQLIVPSAFMQVIQHRP
ncbi:hypothetical protein D3C80_2035910 [compost metagenome]